MPMADAVFAPDRGHNCKESITLFNETLGATGIGTHKRSLDFPFVFGETALAKKQKGPKVAEKGCRAIYSATKKGQGFGRDVEADVYMESFSGRIAAVYHNNVKVLGAHKFTLVPKNNFRGSLNVNAKKIQALQTLHDTPVSTARNSGRDERQSTRRSGNVPATSSTKLQLIYDGVTHSTYYQSEDPAWFLLRSFKFTSRTSHLSVRAVVRNFKENISGMSTILKGVTLTGSSSLLPEREEQAFSVLTEKFDCVCDCLGIERGEAGEERPGLSNFLLELTEDSAKQMRVQDLKSILRTAGRRPPEFTKGSPSGNAFGIGKGCEGGNRNH